MAKVKNKRNACSADKVHKKKKAEAFKKKLNPFEVHINKEKQKVLGKKSKHDRGLPGVSRAKAIQKRKETLGTEMKLMHKTNAFIDKRIGEKNNQLSAEDRMIARFAAERAKQHTKKSIYNLADDEILTHRGQTLEQIEKFDDPRSSDEEDEGGKKFGGLDDDFVSEGHFGGGILSRTDSKDGAKSHKDLIEQLIAESKKRKAEKQKEKEQTLDLTEKLDDEWKHIQPLVFKRPRVEEKGQESAIDKLLSQADKKSQDYDKMMRELKFEKRGTPSDALKNDEKQAREEKERIEKLEREREQRMLGDDEVPASKATPVASKHRSADDLDDNFDLEDEKEFMLAYDKDGKPLVPEKILKDFSVPNAKAKFDDGISDTSSDDDGDDEADDEDDKENDEDDEENEDIEENKDGEEEEEDTDSEDIEVKEQESTDNKESDKDTKKSKSNTKLDLANDTNENRTKAKSENAAVKNEKYDDDDELSKKCKKDNKSSKKIENEENSILIGNDKDSDGSQVDDGSDDDDESDDGSDEADKDAVDDLKDLKESEEETDDEVDEEDNNNKIKSFFDLKLAAGDNLKELLSGKSPQQQSTALQKLIKSYDPGLAENNKELLTTLFAHLLQYINDLFTKLTDEGEVIKAFLVFDKLAPYFYDLAHTNKVSSKKFIVEVLKEKRENYLKKPRRIPDLDTLVFFKLISLLYPTSDFRHPVTTPALIFMSEILTLSRFKCPYSISRGLFLSSIMLEYTALSQRLVPAAINFLRGILYLSANISILNPIQVVPPFRLQRDVRILHLEDDCSKMAVDNKMAAKDLVLNEFDNDFKIRCSYTAVVMLREVFDYFTELEAQHCLFEPHISLIGRIDLDLYPKKISAKISSMLKYMKECLEMKTFTPLANEKKRPKALRLYEPDIQDVFTGSKSSKLPREMAERARLQTKYKKEMKGALREIRRDKAYIGSVKIRQKIHSDNVRKEKVRQIYKDASIQQGELNQLKRKK